MYPGSFIWRRIDDGWLVSKVASTFFAFSALIIAGMTIVLLADIRSQNLGSMGNSLLGVGGVLAAVSVFFPVGRHVALLDKV